jgi:hypothetical protein
MSATLPATFLAALQQPGASALYWVEIEGLPYAYGTREQPAAFWTALPLAQRLEGIRPYLPKVPEPVDARLDPLEGIASPGECRLQIVDADGLLTQAANVGREDADPDALYLTADVAAGAATLNVGGNLAAWPATGTGYIGRTTFSYTGKGAGTLTGVTPGRYRSPDVLHTAGEPVTQYPVHLKTRRAWLYLALATSGAWSVADRVTRYAGEIDDYQLEAGLSTWSLVVRTPEKGFADATLFRDLRSGTLRSSLPGPESVGASATSASTEPGYQATDEADPGVIRDDAGAVVLELARTDQGGAGALAADEWLYLRVEDEILVGQWDGPNARLKTIRRGLFGTAVAQHAAGTDWREGVSIVATDAAGLPEAAHSKFTAGDRPEELVLQLLCAAGIYGVLPSGWNAGREPAGVDVASFEAIRDEVHLSDHLVGWVDEPVSFKDLVVEHILKPWGLYLVHGADDLVRLGYLRQGPPTSTVATIDASVVKGQPRWRSGADQTIGEYRFACDLDALGGLDGDPATIMVDVLVDTQRLYSKQRTRTIEHRTIFAHYEGGIADPVSSYRRALRTFDSRRAFFAAQYGRPPPVLQVTTLFSLFPVQPGEWVTVNVTQIPSMTGAARSYSGPGFVRSKKPTDREWVVELEVLLLGATLDRYATVGPAGVVASKAAGAVTLEMNVFGASTPTVDAAAFAVGDVCVFVSPACDQVTATVTVTGVAGNVLSMAAVPAAVAAGWLIVWADYDQISTGQKTAKRGAMADAFETLGVNGARAHRYTGI